jgi:hypothetical protein
MVKAIVGAEAAGMVKIERKSAPGVPGESTKRRGEFLRKQPFGGFGFRVRVWENAGNAK